MILQTLALKNVYLVETNISRNKTFLEKDKDKILLEIDKEKNLSKTTPKCFHATYDCNALLF